MTILLVSDIVEKNGKTIKENNLVKEHVIKLGSLVEITYEGNEQQGVRLFVVNHSRDCDGTPLYDLSINKDYQEELEASERKAEANKNSSDPIDRYLNVYNQGKFSGSILRHYGEESLKLIRE